MKLCTKELHLFKANIILRKKLIKMQTLKTFRAKHKDEVMRRKSLPPSPNVYFQ
jgi:hypothetical protein